MDTPFAKKCYFSIHLPIFGTKEDIISSVLLIQMRTAKIAIANRRVGADTAVAEGSEQTLDEAKFL